MAGETSKLPKLLQDEINKAVTEGVKAELKKLNSAKDIVPAAEEELSDEKKAAIEMLRGLGFEKPEEAYKHYYGGGEFNLGGEE